ncbi:hypothetical protein QT992_27745 [Microcoleus sp. T3_D1]
MRLNFLDSNRLPEVGSNSFKFNSLAVADTLHELALWKIYL